MPDKIHPLRKHILTSGHVCSDWTSLRQGTVHSQLSRTNAYCIVPQSFFKKKSTMILQDLYSAFSYKLDQLGKCKQLHAQCYMVWQESHPVNSKPKYFKASSKVHIHYSSIPSHSSMIQKQSGQGSSFINNNPQV